MLSVPHRRSIHSSLSPILGEEETDALMSEFPASPSDVPVTATELALMRSEVARGFADQRAYINDLFRQMAMWTVGAMIAGMGLSAGIAAGVAQAVGGG